MQFNRARFLSSEGTMCPDRAIMSSKSVTAWKNRSFNGVPGMFTPSDSDRQHHRREPGRRIPHSRGLIPIDPFYFGLAPFASTLFLTAVLVGETICKCRRIGRCRRSCDSGCKADRFGRLIRLNQGGDDAQPRFPYGRYP